MKRKLISILVALVLVLSFSLVTALPAMADDITIAAIAGVTAPVTGATPVTTITATAQYTGTVTWSPADATFEGDTAYTAFITLTAVGEYTLVGVTANFFTVAGATTATNPADSGVITAVFPATAAVIDIDAIPGVTAPVVDQIPVTTITETAQYTGTVAWAPSVATTFLGSTAYTATITLTAKTGFTLVGVGADFFTVAGSATVSNEADLGVVTATFAATAAAATEIDVDEILGVTAPIVGATPVTTITADAQYTGTVTWAPDDAAFLGEQIYTATITLTPEPGFTLLGVIEDFFTVAGADTVSNDADSGVITAVFPATDAATVTILDIPGVTVPATGATPVTTVTETAQYTGTVAWAPDVPAFLEATVYTATITLTAKTGFTFDGVAQDSFLVDGATATNVADTGVVVAEFPETATTIDVPGILDVTIPATGDAPVTVITPDAQYTGTVVWSPADAAFLGEQVYTAFITLTPEPGFTLTGVAANFFTVAGATATNPANSGVITAIFPATAVAEIDIDAIPGVTVPVTGATPVTVITETDQYTGTVAWAPADAAFVEGTAYTATITLTAKAGFTLTGVGADFFTVAGSATVSNEADLGVVTATFAETATTITIAGILGVTAPVTGASPVTAVTEAVQYTGTVTWAADDDPFEAATVYTATITLTAKAGFTLTGVAANFFTVAGATATNAASSGVITAVFPMTYDTILTLNDGWTLFSTDNYIISTGATSSAWVGTPTLIYSYNGIGYTEYVGEDPDSAFAVLSPVEALYVNMPGGGFVGLNYSDILPSPSSKDLVEGWNLVSSAVVDDAAAVFAALRYVLVGPLGGQQAVGLASIVAQGTFNTIGDSDFSNPALTDAHWITLEGVNLSPFDGYWVYMYADATFSVFPN